jgi:hypothetical protein
MSRFGSAGFRSNRGPSNFSNSRFTNASYSQFGSGRLGSRRFGSQRFDGFGRGDEGFHRFGRSGYGYGGFGHGSYGGGGADFWVLGDLFGLALDFTRLAIFPPFGNLGWNFFGLGLQALDPEFGGSNDEGYGHNSGNYQQQAYAPLCPAYYSDENPGCAQRL